MRLFLLLPFLVLAGCAGMARIPSSEPPAPRPPHRSKAPAEGCSLGPAPSTITYGAHAEQVADLYLPSRKDAAGILVSVHGGGWGTGSRKEHRELARRLVREGCYAVVVPDYRTDEARAYPNQIDDVIAAVEEAKAVIGRQGYTYEVVGALGTSAGAYIVAQASVLHPRAFQRVVGASGPYDLSWDDGEGRVARMLAGASPAAASPVHSAHGGQPPHLLLAWTEDPKVPAWHTVRYAQALRAAGVPASLAEVDGTVHDGRALLLARLSEVLAFLAEAP